MYLKIRIPAERCGLLLPVGGIRRNSNSFLISGDRLQIIIGSYHKHNSTMNDNPYRRIKWNNYFPVCTIILKCTISFDDVALFWTIRRKTKQLMFSLSENQCLHGSVYQILRRGWRRRKKYCGEALHA